VLPQTSACDCIRERDGGRAATCRTSVVSRLPREPEGAEVRTCVESAEGELLVCNPFWMRVAPGVTGKRGRRSCRTRHHSPAAPAGGGE
jgi:hypothetical protein